MMENASAGCGVAHVSATVLIAQRVPPGRERVYRHWQNRTRYIVETFDGFERKEVYRPGSAADRERVTAYRFAGLGRLTTWLRSEAGRSVLAESTSLFEKPPTLEIRLGTPWQEHGSMVISHDLQPERTEDFLYWQQRLLQEQEKFPGFGGAELYQPEKDAQQRWVVSFFYRTGAHLRVWLESEVRASLLDEGMDYLVTTRDRSPASDGTWPLEHQVESAGVARQITNMVLGEWRMGQDTAQWVQLVVSELVTNAVLHARPPVYLHLHREAFGHRVWVGITDGGPVTHGDPGTVSRGLGEHGRGLTIIDELANVRGARPHPGGNVTHWARLPAR
ncbi:ATP-binding protein [Streptomyces sp. NBC_01794]|uniref:ATP-binding protein n=1 Tax=Streptomyces sp. NBC_01794 TaxID=2975942 RepID=UPI0030878464|nr:antibiotic biosynthesis monooxygenase [Streptomyces sp. NBC_01794]WSB05183.1 antibiotic biosynthesis monooxygenase [Streptomyces sp. NBC_01794]